VHARWNKKRLSHLLFLGKRSRIISRGAVSPQYQGEKYPRTEWDFSPIRSAVGEVENYCCKTGNGPSLLIHKLQHIFLCATELLLLLLLLLLATFSFSMKQ
jgi:hypothetical protein